LLRRSEDSIINEHKYLIYIDNFPGNVDPGSTPHDTGRHHIRGITTMQKNATTTPIDQPLAAQIARENALWDMAEHHKVSPEGMAALDAQWVIAGWTDMLSVDIAKGRPFDSAEVVRYFRWAVMKMIEFNELLPEEHRGDLSRECFMRSKGALTGNAPTTDAAEMVH